MDPASLNIIVDFIEQRPELYKDITLLGNVPSDILYKIICDVDFFIAFKRNTRVFLNIVDVMTSIKLSDPADARNLNKMILIFNVDLQLYGLFTLDNMMNLITYIHSTKKNLYEVIISADPKIRIISLNSIQIEEIYRFCGRYINAKILINGTAPEDLRDIEIIRLNKLLSCSKKPTVYFIANTQDTYVNIGVTYDIFKCLARLQSKYSRNLYVYYQIITPKHREIIHYIYEKFSNGIPRERFDLSRRELYVCVNTIHHSPEFM